MGLLSNITGFGRPKNTGASAVFGFLFLFISSIGLWVNEGRSVDQMDALYEMQQAITTLPDTKIHPDLDKKAVLIQGKVSATSPAKDPEFNIASSNSLALQRIVEMYQWKQHSRAESKHETSYEYSKEWSSEPIDSSTFKESEAHYNPSFPYPNEIFSTEAKIGDYILSKSVLAKIPFSNTLGLSSFPDTINNAKNHKSFLFIGKDVNQPSIGDVKISYKTAAEGIYSIAAASANKYLTDFTTENNKSLSFVRQGIVPATKIFADEQANNTTLTWILRFTGLFVMFLSFSGILNYFTGFADYIPVIGPLLSGVKSVIAGVLTLILGSFVIAIAWFSARPILSISILIIGGIIAFLLNKFAPKRKVADNTKNASTATTSPHS